ncbi:uncharacterized protein BDR25DRAFT_310731 [Lindgomyces ingoldianus]|uniref:Uncharacterized protein n=1 Tax=Lindgomyces ingoldianus TaxID=673940 RepID=A0ACB6R9Y0_9PLEO|nr:uncharacterized protein BDR25DRAFT_310731 [Lindgomyces ingoldianus]KAF2475332.1 hypothetical protein BDR25DRAFT_310731 [Lindgomyces ingoldianus]
MMMISFYFAAILAAASFSQAKHKKKPKEKNPPLPAPTNLFPAAKFKSWDHLYSRQYEIPPPKNMGRWIHREPILAPVDLDGTEVCLPENVVKEFRDMDIYCTQDFDSNWEDRDFYIYTAEYNYIKNLTEFWKYGYWYGNPEEEACDKYKKHWTIGSCRLGNSNAEHHCCTVQRKVGYQIWSVPIATYSTTPLKPNKLSDKENPKHQVTPPPSVPQDVQDRLEASRIGAKHSPVFEIPQVKDTNLPAIGYYQGGN